MSPVQCETSGTGAWNWKQPVKRRRSTHFSTRSRKASSRGTSARSIGKRLRCRWGGKGSRSFGEGRRQYWMAPAGNKAHGAEREKEGEAGARLRDDGELQVGGGDGKGRDKAG